VATSSTQRVVVGRALQKRNARILRDNPLCGTCTAIGRIRAAVEIDHIIPLHQGGQDIESNLQGLCIPCHEAKSAREARDRCHR
jgi:5-methylcytosine-specific restriction enzyme A